MNEKSGSLVFITFFSSFDTFFMIIMGSFTAKQLGLFQMREDIFDFPKCGFCYTYPFYSYSAPITISESVVFVILIVVWYAK
jgi:hypothetical protein